MPDDPNQQPAEGEQLIVVPTGKLIKEGTQFAAMAAFMGGSVPASVSPALAAYKTVVLKGTEERMVKVLHGAWAMWLKLEGELRKLFPDIEEQYDMDGKKVQEARCSKKRNNERNEVKKKMIALQEAYNAATDEAKPNVAKLIELVEKLVEKNVAP